MYPPHAVAFSVGFSDTFLMPICGIFSFAPRKETQWFRMPDWLPPVTHFKVSYAAENPFVEKAKGCMSCFEVVSSGLQVNS